MRNPDALDKAYTEINFGRVKVSLDFLGDIIEHRRADGEPITSITADVHPFSMSDFADFLARAGAKLVHLCLRTRDDASHLFPMDLPKLVGAVQQHCSRLLYLWLPITAAHQGT